MSSARDAGGKSDAGSKPPAASKPSPSGTAPPPKSSPAAQTPNGSARSAPHPTANTNNPGGTSATNGSNGHLPLSSATVTATTISTVSAARMTVSPWMVLGLCCAAPVLLPVGIFMSPVLVGAIAVAYVIAAVIYLLTAQIDNPRASKSLLPILPLHPVRVFKINLALIDHVTGLVFGPVTPISLRWVIRKALRRHDRSYTVICQDIKYNPTKPNLTLDIHCGEDVTSALRPVIIFIYGGAWSSGNKSMYIPLAQTLQEAGYVVVCPNYTLFPDGRVGDMVFDVATAVHWVHNNIRSYGGDASQIHLMGHSAGAHLCALTVIHDMVSYLETRFPDDPRKVPRLSHLPDLDDCLPQIQGLILLAGVFDVNTHYVFETRRGLEEISAMSRVMGSSKRGFDLSSPSVILKKLDHELLRTGEVARLLPKHWLVVHGDVDKTVPLTESQEFCRVLRHDVGVRGVRLKVYPRVDHARPVAELMLPDSDYSVHFLAELAVHVHDSRESHIEMQRDNAGHVVIDGKYHHSTGTEE
ncbi:hypothetical protein HDU96_006338 [Phlyctochytrium bullatum]|nr:hypothetical protein HDU96_006338 [Phlyctochytrium bullatum]